MISEYKSLSKEKRWLWLSCSGILWLSLSLVVNFYAARYAGSSMSNSVTDIVLSNIPVFDVDAIFIYGGVAFCLFVFLLVSVKPATIPFVSKAIALFVLTRAIFISLTHLNVFPSHIIIEAPKVFGLFTNYGDLFFSGHTGLPFLMSLLFWDDRFFRILFIAISVFFGAIVLMGHLHYSIDVLGAFFITHSVYYLAVRLFPKDKAIFDSMAKP